MFLLPLVLDDITESVFCLFSQNQIVEILGQQPIQRIPCSPLYLQGVVRYRDELLPVIDIGQVCNWAAARRGEYKQLMVVRTGAVDSATGEPMKAIVSANLRVQTIKLSGQVLATEFTEAPPPPSLANSGILRGFFRRKEHYLALMNLDQITAGVYGS